MQCEECGYTHEGKFGSGRFCSRKCSNKRNDNKQETKISACTSCGVLVHINKRAAHKHTYCNVCKKSKEIKVKKNSTYHPLKRSASISETWLKKYRETPFDKLGVENRRRRVFEEQNYMCNRCGLSEWFDQKIVLELEHIDGFSDNNERSNLEGLCPNCHSITKTWRGRNKPSIKKIKITDEELIEALKSSQNIRQALLKVGLAAKGGNYEKAKRILRTSNSEAE